ncbi:hypothetical protein BS47DRAFT_1369942 [Hydnum rufescens UP504]|uniref:Uncharacterized protein n=1 Tax=Hydnum rufescens UP504 TaxID=1448309 RepID=A0A9P6AB26_9AGAM|nr:hypothetical protein BS47DRAFT_1369942 [Hydnum rufescens UP504]
MDKDKCGAAAKADNPDLACHPEMWIAYPQAVKSQLTPYFSPIMILYWSLHDGGVMDFSSLHASMGTDTPIEYEIFNGGDPRSTECTSQMSALLHHRATTLGATFLSLMKSGDKSSALTILAIFS